MQPAEQHWRFDDADITWICRSTCFEMTIAVTLAYIRARGRHAAS